MRSTTWVLTGAFVAGLATMGAAQTGPAPMSAMEITVACAPPPTLDGAPDHVVRVVGGQDSSPRNAFGTDELIVLDSGTKVGLQLGQQFFVRRANSFGMYGFQPAPGRGAKTLGWVHVVAVNESTAVAQIDHACGEVSAADYLQPFATPVLPSNVESTEATGEPDFTALARVVNGNEDRSIFGIGDFALIDRGSGQGVMPGQRFAVYRDLRKPGLPLVSVGEVVVVAASESVALARITRARDAVFEGDYVAPRK